MRFRTLADLSAMHGVDATSCDSKKGNAVIRRALFPMLLSAIVPLLGYAALPARADVIDRIDIENHSNTDVQFELKKEGGLNGYGCLKPGQSDRDYYLRKVVDVVIVFQRSRAKNGGCGGTGMFKELWFRFKQPKETFKAMGDGPGYYVDRS